MRVTALQIKHVLGIEEMSIECGRITTISGRNATGKSSVLAALQAGLGGGDLAKLQKVGSEDEAAVVLLLDEGKYRVERQGKEVDVLQRVDDSAAYEKIRRPQSWLDSLLDPLLTNPLRFLSAHPNERADILLKVIPLQLDRDAFMKRLDGAWPAGKPLVDGHPLEVLSYTRGVLFDERTGVNRSARDKEASAYELQKALPAEMPADPAAALAEASRERDVLLEKLATKRSEAEVAERQAFDAAKAKYDEIAAVVSGEFKTTAAKLRGAADTRIADLATALERQIAALKEEHERAVAGIREATDKAVLDVKEEGEKKLAVAEAEVEKAEADASDARRGAFALVDGLQPDLQKLNERVAELAAIDKNLADLRSRKALADKFQSEADALKEMSQRLTAAIEAVDAQKQELAKGIPIPGLEVVGKQILVDGVPFDQLNAGARIGIAVKVAALRARTQVLPVIFVDGAEALDREHYELLVRELEASGCQAFIAKVEDDELRVEARAGTPPPSEAKVLAMPPAAAAPARAGRRQRTLSE